MALIPRPQVRDIDRALRDVAKARSSARRLLGDVLAQLAQLDHEEDHLLAMRADAVRR